MKKLLSTIIIIAAITSSVHASAQEIKGIYIGMSKKEYDALKVDEFFTIANVYSTDPAEAVFVDNKLASFKFYFSNHQHYKHMAYALTNKFPELSCVMQACGYNTLSLTFGWGNTATLSLTDPAITTREKQLQQLRSKKPGLQPSDL